MTPTNSLPFTRNSPDPRDSESPFGALTFMSWKHDWNNFFYGQDAQIERAAVMMRDAGIEFARVDFLWSDLEPQEGRFDFTHQDHVLEILSRYGIKILATLNYNPLWRTFPWNTAPDLRAFMLYVRAVVRHYKERVKYWEIWNEPDHETYWTPQDELVTYSQLLKMGYAAIKEEDASAVVLMGGLCDGGSCLRKIYLNAGREAFDIVNIHPFINPLLPNALSAMQEIHAKVLQTMVDFNDAEKPIWFTEIGCPGAAKSTGGWWAGAVPNEVQQAEWLETVYSNVLNWKGVQKVFWAFFRDTDRHFKNDTDNFGLLRLDFSPKPAYVAYKKITHGNVK